MLRIACSSLMFVSLGLCLAACGDGIPEGCDAFVRASDDAQDSIQEAFLSAADGDVICLSQGDFTGFEKELTLSADDVTVQGQGLDATVLDFDGEGGANGIKITGDGVTIKDLQVKNTVGDGIRGDLVEDITFHSIKVLWEGGDLLEHGAYGLYPVGSSGVVIQESVVEGARDAGIYVGQSNDILVVDNEAYDNVAGIEIENSFDAEVRGNYAHDNTGGLLIFNLPGLEQAGGARTKAYENRLEDNNTDNFAEPGTAVSAVPRGTGFIMLAADGADVHDNEIKGNEGAAVILLHCHQALFGSGCNDAEYDAFPRGNWIHDNVFTSNGTDPPDFLIDFLADDMGNYELPVAGVFWDGGYEGCPDAGVDSIPEDDLNCFSNNLDQDGDSVGFVNFNICDNFENQSTDLGPMDCTHDGLDPMGE